LAHLHWALSFMAPLGLTEQLKQLLSVKEQIVSLNLNKMPVTDDDRHDDCSI
jgi:hypothetical protein